MLVVVLVVPATLRSTDLPAPFDQTVIERLNETKPSAIFLGNSLLDTRINADYLTQLTGVSTESLAIEGTAPGIWYLQIQNVLAATEETPELVYVFFHDDLITRPIYFTGQKDSALRDSLTHSNKSGYGELPSESRTLGDEIKNVFTTIYPVAESRSKSNRSPISSIGAGLAGMTQEELSDESGTLFSFTNIRDQAAEIQQPKFHGTFDSMIDNSFLPLLIESANSINAELTLVRVAARPNNDGSPNEPQSLANYSSKLTDYLASANVRYVDMTAHVEEAGIDAAMYHDGYHLKHRFRETYTEFFAEWISSISNNDDEDGSAQ